MTYRQRKAAVYQWIFTWAIKKWRGTLNNPVLKGYEGKLSAHAILRYLERIEGRDMQAELITPEVTALIKEMGGSGKFVVNNIQYTVDKGKVLTVCRPNPNAPVVRGLDRDSEVARKWSF